MQELIPCLWFENKAEEAAAFYTSIFKNSRILKKVLKQDGSVLCVEFELNGQPYLALNGGTEYQFNPATSLIAKCETQEEIDYLWQKFSVGGQEIQCGWITDKFGFTWQVVPSILIDIISGADKERAYRALQAIGNMKKLDIATIKAA